MNYVSRQAALVGAAALTLVAPLGAQRARAGSCPAIDSTAEWFTKQRAWLDESKASWSDSTMRTALLAATASSGAPTGALLGYEISTGSAHAPQPGDSAVVAKLKQLASVRGSTWPTRSVVGARGVLAVWTLASRDTSLARVALHRLMEAGPEESPPAAVAMLEDRARLRLGRKQLYGTQLQRTADGTVTPLPIEDLAHLDLRRDGASLPPLAQSLCAARAAAR